MLIIKNKRKEFEGKWQRSVGRCMKFLDDVNFGIFLTKDWKWRVDKEGYWVELYQSYFDPDKSFPRMFCEYSHGGMDDDTSKDGSKKPGRKAKRDKQENNEEKVVKDVQIKVEDAPLPLTLELKEQKWPGMRKEMYKLPIEDKQERDFEKNTLEQFEAPQSPLKRHNSGVYKIFQSKSSHRFMPNDQDNIDFINENPFSLIATCKMSDSGKIIYTKPKARNK